MTRLVGWILFLCAALAGLDALSIPPSDGVSVAFSAVRIVAIGLDLYLMVTTVAGLLLRMVRAGAAVRFMDLCTVPFVRGVLDRAAAAALVASLVTPGVAQAAERPVDPPPVMRLVVGPQPAAPAVAAPQPEAPAANDVHEVRAGQNCWSIAADVLEARLGRPARDAEIVPYWRALIAANAGRFRTGDPDLIFSGQQLLLP